MKVQILVRIKYVSEASIRWGVIMTSDTGDNNPSEVFLIETSNRETAVRSLFGKADLASFSGKSVALKANFNSADPFPASTHLGTLKTTINVLKEAGVSEITLAERSGIENTRENLEQLGIFELSKQMGFKVVVLEEEPKENWVKIDRRGTHWLKGFYISKVFLDSDIEVQTCCLKAHRFGGHFTMSLKNSVGLVAKRVPGGLYNYMWELHGSPYQRQMIAEINKFYKVDFVVMDAMKAFVSGGPEKGTVVEPNLMLASRDRVAIDAVGVAILRMFGASSIMKKPVFELDQIRRAAELGVGASSASAIKLTALDDKSQEIVDKIERILLK
jgi:uncharacterized protein (DUF362 family)